MTIEMDASTHCGGCERSLSYRLLDYCSTCELWYCEDCYTEEVEHECIADSNDDDDDDDDEHDETDKIIMA